MSGTKGCSPLPSRVKRMDPEKSNVEAGRDGWGLPKGRDSGKVQTVGGARRGGLGAGQGEGVNADPRGTGPFVSSEP